MLSTLDHRGQRRSAGLGFGNRADWGRNETLHQFERRLTHTVYGDKIHKRIDVALAHSWYNPWTRQAVDYVLSVTV